jgi:nitrite reductase (NADH) small subunit
MKERRWYLVADTESIPLKEGRRVNFGRYEVALFNLGREYRAVDNQCPHKQGPLADGIIAGNHVFCPLHNWKISLGTGCAISGGTGHVKVYPVKVIQNKIYIAFEEGAFCEPESALSVESGADNVNS